MEFTEMEFKFLIYDVLPCFLSLDPRTSSDERYLTADLDIDIMQNIIIICNVQHLNFSPFIFL